MRSRVVLQQGVLAHLFHAAPLAYKLDHKATTITLVRTITTGKSKSVRSEKLMMANLSRPPPN